MITRLEGKVTYSDIKEDDEQEEFLVTVYGGDTVDSQQIVAQTEIIGYVRKVFEQEEDSDEIHTGIVVIGPVDLAVHLIAEKTLWINRLTVSSPKRLQWVRKEVDLPMPYIYGNEKHGPNGHIRISKDETVTINFPEQLLEVK